MPYIFDSLIFFESLTTTKKHAQMLKLQDSLIQCASTGNTYTLELIPCLVTPFQMTVTTVVTETKLTTHHVNTPMLTMMDLVVPDNWVAVGSNLDSS